MLVITEQARLRPRAIAVSAADATWTYSELEAEVASRADHLRRLGIGPGDRIAVLSPNRARMVAQIWAIARVGGVSVLLNTRLTEAEIAAQVNSVGAKQVPAIDAVSVGGGALQSFATSRSSPKGDSDFAILFTSGTTGKAKAAVLTETNFLANARSSAANVGGGPGDRWLACLPLFHVGGLAMMFRCAVYGARLDLHEHFDARAVNAAIDSGVTHTSLVATTLARTLEARGQRPAPASLRAILIGGGPAPQALLHRARALAMPVLQTYGLTEACSQVATEPLHMADGTTAGPPLQGTEIRVVDDDGNPVAPDTIGEIEVRGPTVMRGYFQDEAETHHTLWKGWLRTRDLGSLDTRGWLSVVARRTDLIISGGENIYPAEIESILLSHPEIQDAAVIGIDDAEWGQVPVAAIVSATVTPNRLIAWARERMAKFKVPRRVFIVDALPRTASGKVNRVLLRESVLEGGRVVP